MFKTKITKMLGIEHPIIGGTMMWLATPEFVAAISNAGALGIIASAMFSEKEEFRKAVKKIKSLTSKPFAINLNLFPSLRAIPNEDFITVIIEEGIKVVETSGHKAPEEYIDRLKKAGVVVIHKCVGVRYAKKAESLGVDAITVVGFENGGATGILDTGTMVLVPRVVEEVKVPVIGGGGAVDGRGFLAVLALGAEGVIMGTRMLMTEECPIHQRVKEALLKATELDTRLIMRSIESTHRVWFNAAARRVLELEAQQAGLPDIVSMAAGDKAKKMYETGDIDLGTIACSQGIGMIRSVKPVAEVIKDILAQAEQIRQRIKNM
ncbi:MAG: nitronate monooxygenase [Proteobacteria bacterium]|nr:nitronate monooxygenase [Pseudomonadota bacterium]